MGRGCYIGRAIGFAALFANGWLVGYLDAQIGPCDPVTTPICLKISEVSLGIREIQGGSTWTFTVKRILFNRHMIPTCHQEEVSPEEVTSVTRRRHRLAVLVLSLIHI